MNVTKGWLADFVELNETAADIAKDMTMSGSRRKPSAAGAIPLIGLW